MSVSFGDLLNDNRVHVFDGAMGTMLYNRGVFVNACFDELNLRQPRLVRQIHEEYLKAGAEVLETNTFGANPHKLAAFGLSDKAKEINRAAGHLARDAARGEASVLGAIGPLGVRLEPFGKTGFDEAFQHFRIQAEGLLEGGVDGFVLETFNDLTEIRAAVEAVQSLTELPVLAEMTIGEDLHTSYGTDVETLTLALEEMRVDAVGLNCSVGPVVMLGGIEKMAGATQLPIVAQPNAGLPREVGNRTLYLSSPEYMATYAKLMVESGARMVGGCCGTTPEHIKQIRSFVSSVSPHHTNVRVSQHDIVAPEGVEPVPLAGRSAWGRRLANGEFVTAIEIVPPKGCDPNPMLKQCQAIKDAGVSAVNVPDGPRAQSRMGVISSSILIEREVGIETVIHYACRDRNLLGMMSDLLGAAAAGLRNLLLVTGDPPKMGPYPDATAVFDIDAIGLTNLVHRLNRGMDPGNNPIGEPSRFVIGVGVNPAAIDLERELRRFYWKVDAGAEFAVTQPVFDSNQLEEFLRRVEEYHIPVIAGIWPLVSYRNAEFLANEVPGIHVPKEILDRMRLAQERGKEAAVEEGVTIAREMFDRVKDHVQGIQVSAPFGRVPVAVEVFGSELV